MVFLRGAVTVLCFVIFIFYSSLPTYASSSVFFRDDFNSINDFDWIISDMQNEVEIIHNSSNEGLLRLSSPIDHEIPFLQLKKDLGLLDNFYVEFRYRMTGPGFGSGLILSDKQLEPYSREMSWDDFIFVIWPNGTGGYSIVSRPCPSAEVTCVHDEYRQQVSPTQDSQWHVIKFNYLEGVYTVYIDNVLFFESSHSDLKVKYIYFGSPHRTITNTAWPIHELDYIHVSSEEDSIVQKFKMVLIPGLGSSWNLDAIMDGSTDSDWEVPEFVDLYDSLIKSIENNGYVRDKDLYIFGYDWRKSIDNLADDLQDYIDAMNLNTGEKIYLVGHSMGGLVARSYVQKYGLDNVEKIVTLGSPHQGVLDAYPVWEGAALWGDVWWEKAALELAVHLNRKPGESRVKALRSQAPGIKDLLPVYEFLVSNGLKKPLSQLSQKNEYLAELNNILNGADSVMKTFMGIGIQTRSALNVTQRTGLDKLLDRWEDGKPLANNPFIFADGDGTVLKTSAAGPFSSTLEINKSHIGLAYEENSIESILEEFGLDRSKAEVVEPDKRDNFLAVILRSPGRLLVCDESGETCNENFGLYFPTQKLFLLPGYGGQKISAKVIEDGFGKYDLHVGLVYEEEDWSVLKGNLEASNQIDGYIIEGRNDSTDIIPDEDTENHYLNAAASELGLFSPSWDRGGYFTKARDKNIAKNLRLKYIRLLRTVLRQEYKKAVKKNNPDYLLAVNAVWNTNDYLARVLLKGQGKNKESSVAAYIKRTKNLSQLVNTRLAKGNNLLTGMIYEFASKKMANISSLDTKEFDLRADLLMSVEYLLYTTLDNI